MKGVKTCKNMENLGRGNAWKIQEGIEFVWVIGVGNMMFVEYCQNATVSKNNKCHKNGALFRQRYGHFRP
jgi:hypothetical protein